jgi:short-subunit dehydrogenase
VRTDFDDNAGIENPKYKTFSNANSMDAHAVAAVGLQALGRGEPFVIAGARNRIAAIFFGLLPKTAAPAIMKKILDSLV